jgi:probable rRNA maturation factor
MKIAKKRTRKHAPDRLQLVIEYVVRPQGTPDESALRRWAMAALLQDVRQAELGLRIVDEEEGRELNREYRGKDYATNVLTFALSEGEPVPGLPLFGDIVLTAPVVEREAAEQGKSLDAHYAHLVVHSMLHLQGFDHIEEEQAEDMEALETVIVMRLGFADPYGEERP